MDEKFSRRTYELPADALKDFDPAAFQKLAQAVMPYGKYAGTRLVDLPEAYVLWFKQKGFPEGELGRLLAELAEIKANGLEFLFDGLVHD